MRIRMEGIRVDFGRVRALDGVDVELREGATTVLVGPNGAGKSTLFGVLLGLLRPDGGRVLVDGRAITRDGGAVPRSFRGRLAYLPDGPAFSEGLTGYQVLRFFARARGVRRARVEAVLEQVGLAAAAGRAVRGYSRGMRQRLGLGVALLAEPELLVLDEPTGGLDQEGLSLLWSVLDAWRVAGRTVVLSTHDIASIERRADAVVVLEGGRVLAQGTPGALRQASALPVRIRMGFGDARSARGLARRLGEAGIGELALTGTDLDVMVPPDAVFGAVRMVNGEAGDLGHFRVEEPGLDEIYEHILQEAR